MRTHVAIENIEEMRQNQGIDDVELRMEVRDLKAGDLVRITLLGSASAETLTVRITSIVGPAFRGRLVRRPTSAGFFDVTTTTLLSFTANHIHSVPKSNPRHQANPEKWRSNEEAEV
jgi:hypothetical protein